jgi:transposase
MLLYLHQQSATEVDVNKIRRDSVSKQCILVENGTFNRNYGKVQEERFTSDAFYDPQDIVQVKYEMLRTANETQRSIEEIAGKFGFSRAAFYKIKTSYNAEGVSAFVPDKSGPKNALKLTSEHQKFINDYLERNPDASSGSIAAILYEERGLRVSKRTIERYRSGQGKRY